MNRAFWACLISLGGALAAPALAQTISGGSCTPSSLSGPYAFMLNGRIITPTGSFQDVFDGLGTATFDGVSKVTFSGTDNSLTAAGQSFSYAGTYTLPSTCFGTITLSTGVQATFALVVWSNGQQFEISGTNTTTSATPTYVWGGSGSNPAPPACATPTLSGAYTYEVTGGILSTTTESDVANESGVLVFDGQGNVTSDIYTLVGSQTPSTSSSATGTYTVTSSCLASATLKDTSGNARTLNFTINGAYGQNLKTIEATPNFFGTGSAHSAFYFTATTSPGNAAQSIVNVASYAVNATPAGSVFAIFGNNLATKTDTPSAPLPTTALDTTVTVNGVPVPLFFVSTGQINAQMPWNVPGNTVASVIVKNTGANGSISNAAPVYVPAAATPGISFYSTNRAVVVNVDGNVNSSTDTASVGDEEVLYFTGGGPVDASGKLTTGAVSPPGLSPVTDPNASVTVGGVAATVIYIGLTPGSIGLYQANFDVPQLAKGTYPVVLTISGTASNSLGGQAPNPVMTVGN